MTDKHFTFLFLLARRHPIFDCRYVFVITLSRLWHFRLHFHSLNVSNQITFGFLKGGESGSADTARDPRGFAVKFYTDEGIWDLVGNNTPIFFLRDPILFPSFIHTQKRNPQTHLKDPDMFWDFISLRPETTHQVLFLFGDRGTPDGYRFMNGFVEILVLKVICIEKHFFNTATVPILSS